MYIIVAGGGKVGFYLAKTLLQEGHEVLIIEKDRRKVERIAEELGAVVLRGDACELGTLGEAGTNRADVLVAATGDDQDNLVICQMAKRKFRVGQAIARINNPKNETIFRLVGIDATVSSTQVILAEIEQEIPRHALVRLLRLRHADLDVVEATVSNDSSVIGKTLREIALPSQTTVAVIIRQGNLLIPSGQTSLAAGDEVVLLTRPEHEPTLRGLLLE